jgi:3'-5' exonuclease
MNSTSQKLDVVASLCGFAGKQTLDGYDVVPMVQAEAWDKLTTYCESDVLNTWLIFLRYQRLTGQFSVEQSEQWESTTRDYLQSFTNQDSSLRHDKFLQAWQPASNLAADQHVTDIAITQPPSDTPTTQVESP